MILRHDFLSIIEFNNLDYTLPPFMVTQHQDYPVLPDLEQHLVTDFYMTPEDFESDYLSVGGAGFSVAPLFTQSAWFRFHNKAEGPENLYLVGAGTHPGAGLPGVVSSAKVLDHLIPEVVSSPVLSTA